MPENENIQKTEISPRPYPAWVPVCLVFFGFLLRLLAVTTRESVGIDSVRYLTFAQNYIHGIIGSTGPTGLREIPDIGYPLLITIMAGIFRSDIEVVARWVSLFAGTLTLIVVYLLAIRFTGHRAAIYALFMACVCPPLIQYSSLIQTESLFILLFVSCVYLSYAATRRGYNSFWFLLGGILTAYAYLTRGIGITFLFIFPFTIWLMGYIDGHFANMVVRRKYFIGLIIFLIGFAIIAFPYQYMLTKTYGKFVLSDQSIWHTPRMAHPEIDFSADPRYDGTLTSDGTEYLINTPQFYDFPSVSFFTKAKALVGKYLKNQIGIYYYHLRELFPPLYLVLLALGLFASVWDPKLKRGMILFGLWSIPFLILQPFYYTEARYISPITALLVVMIGRGIVMLLAWLWEMFPKVSLWRLEWTLAIILFVALTPMMIYPLTHKGVKYDYPELKKAGESLGQYIQEHGGEGVLAVTPIIGYYADTSPNLVLPKTNMEGVLRFAEIKGIEYIALDERKVYPWRDELRIHIYDEITPTGLTLVFDNKNDSGYRVKIFKIERTN